jgi:Flp pilus assembly protein TadG
MNMKALARKNNFAMIQARRHSRRRLANTTIEMIISFPVLLFLVFGMVEFAQFFYIRNAFVSAARDAARVAVLSSATQSQVTTTLTNTLSEANVTYNSSWLTITDLTAGTTVTDVSTVPAGDQMRFVLTTTYSAIPNAVRPLSAMTGKGIGSGKVITGQCTMLKE